MPIYAYKCGSCGHAKDVLQKLSDAPLSTCPSCGADTFAKQITAAGFQLKGSGWYATDFKGGSGTSAPATASADKPAESKSEGKSESTPASTTKSDSPSASAGGCGASCACH